MPGAKLGKLHGHVSIGRNVRIKRRRKSHQEISSFLIDLSGLDGRRSSVAAY